MALPPKFAGQRLAFAAPAAATTSRSSVPPAVHTLEFYADYCCPFSARMFRTLTGAVAPLVRAEPRWAASLTLLFRQQVQPWHPSSTLMHEAALAVLRLAPDRFWAFSAALFDAQEAFFDANTVDEPRNQTYRRLAKVAGDVGVDADHVYRLLEIVKAPAEGGSLNAGNQVTADLKLVTKMNRLVGIHVTPTIVFDGVVHDISSSWTGDDWKAWLAKNLV